MNRAVYDFSGSVIVVTGATRGIGQGIAEAFAGSGGQVYLLGRSQEAGLAVENEILSRRKFAKFHPCDVTAPDSVEQTFERILSEAGRIDILVNNAGGWTVKHLVEDTPVEEWDTIVDLNLKSVFLCAKMVIPGFKHQRSGRIINITSIGGQTSVKEYFQCPPYVAAKAGVHGLTRVLANELGVFGVTVNALSPSTTISDRLRTVHDEEKMKRLGLKTVVGRLAEVGDIAACALFLASPGSSYVTGQTISVNGGRLMV